MNSRQQHPLTSASTTALFASLGLAVVISLLGALAQAREYKSGIEWAEPKLVDPGPVGGVPSDAVVLFDGKDLSQWDGAEKWSVVDGQAIPGGGAIQSKPTFGDCQVHIEWATPEEVSGEGQGRGNSGVFLMGIYELQVLDSYENVTYFDGQAGAIYKQRPPLVNACRKPGEWQTYDIIWTAPRFNEQGELVEPAYITAFQNGVLIQNHFQIEGDTPYDRPPRYSKHADKLPIGLQFHGNPVRFRNIWVREIPELESKRVAPPSVSP
jgi:hypothetical protein